MVRKILAEVPEEQLQNDLERYRQTAIDIGATDAKIITADKVIIDERVRAKCIYPKCDWYGSSIHCPPNAPDLDFTRRLVSKYRHAIFFTIKVPTETLVWKERTSQQKRESKRSNIARLNILAKIESTAFYDGYYLAMAFGGGPCKPILCPTEEICQALLPGKGCKHPFNARAAMEGMGMDVYLMAAKIGWDIYPFGMCSTVADVPYAMKLGIVFIC